jgi:hypothetical protein
MSFLANAKLSAHHYTRPFYFGVAIADQASHHNPRTQAHPRRSS